jgi:pimeloyl-ACP methyl ester carboxylesterase
MSQFVDLPGVRLAYDDGGSGPAVVFLHGGLLDRRQWDDQFSYFAKDYRVIRYDMRSSGESETDASAEPFCHHEDLYRMLEILGLKRASLVGLSNHSVALDFTIAYPEIVEKLVLVSPGLRGYTFGDTWVAEHSAAMLAALGRKDLAGAVDVFLSMWVDGPHRATTDVSPSVREHLRVMVTTGFRQSRFAPNCKGLEPPAAGRLAEVSAPTLIVLGEQDADDIHAIGKLISAGIKSSKLEWIRDSGHMLPMERPAEFNQVVGTFLAE